MLPTEGAAGNRAQRVQSQPGMLACCHCRPCTAKNGVASQSTRLPIRGSASLVRVWGSLPSCDSHMQNSRPQSQSPTSPASVSVWRPRPSGPKQSASSPDLLDVLSYCASVCLLSPFPSLACRLADFFVIIDEPLQYTEYHLVPSLDLATLSPYLTAVNSHPPPGMAVCASLRPT